MILPFFLVTIFLASFYQGITGFGLALIAAPLVLLVLDKFTVVSSLTVIGLVLNAYLFRRIKQKLNFKLLIPLCLASVICMPFGIWLLKIAPISMIKIIVGSLTIFFALTISFNKLSLPRTRFMTVLAGLFSGLLQTSISMAGPPVVMLLTGTNRAKNDMRKTLVSFFLWMNIISLPFFLLSGTLNKQRISFGVYALPFVILGAYLGNKIAVRVPQKTFKMLAVVTVVITGLVSIYSGFSK